MTDVLTRLVAVRHRLHRDDVARRREEWRDTKNRSARVSHGDRIRCAAVAGLVETHLTEMMEERRGLELLELVTREFELAAGGDRHEATRSA